jgi:diguanylate cyclase
MSVAVTVGAVLLVCAVATERVVAARRHRRELGRVWRLAYTDDLTGLANRRALFAHLDRASLGDPLPDRDGPGPVGVLLIDLDGFKAVNDTYGHRAGDRVLRVVGEGLAVSLGPGCLVARLGGDEFAVTPRDGDRMRLAACVEGVHTVLGQPINLGHTMVKMTASVGASARVPSDSAADLLARADAAMYEAKKQRTGAGPQPMTVCVVDTHQP